MRVCEGCGGMKVHTRFYHGTRIAVRCDDCAGTGLVCLGHENQRTYDGLKAEAHALAIREGWYQEAWDGEPGAAVPVLRRIGPGAEFVQAADPKEAA